MVNFLLASAIIFITLVGWLYVEEIYRRFSKRNPELGPFREGGNGCHSGCCSCNNGRCSTSHKTETRR